MRDMASATGITPATFTRLARAIGYSGWDDLRDAIVEAERANATAPFSSRLQKAARHKRQGQPASEAEIAADMLLADTAGIQQLDPFSIASAAKQLMDAPRIWLAGFRSCRAIAQTLHYQLRLFRPEDVRLIGAEAPEDLDFGALRETDTLVLISFAPYSRSIAETARIAQSVGCRIIALTDTAAAPIAEGAHHLLLFDPTQGPGFFPSLTGAFAIAHALVSTAFALGGEGSFQRLQETEKRLLTLSTFVSPSDSTQ